MQDFSTITPAVLTVGDGRGFIIAHERRIDRYVVSERYVITAAHCLPRLPIVYGEPGWGDWDTTYQNHLAPLGSKPAVSAECVFADPVGGIAVFGKPDSQELYEQVEAYDALAEPATPLKIAAPGTEGCLLSLDEVWFRCGIQMFGGPTFALTAMEGQFVGGMSGSPIISPEGAAVGVACLGGEDGAGNQTETQGPASSLVGNLPGWLLAGQPKDR